MDPFIQKIQSVAPMTRRQFLFGMASVAVLGFSKESQAAVGLFEPFSFGYVTDAHLAIGLPDSYKMLQESQLFLQDVVKGLNEKRVAFTIFGGDQVEGPGKDDTNWQLFIDVAQSLNNPWNFVLGESDISGMAPVDKMRTYGPDWKGKGVESKSSYWSQDPVNGVHIIGLDTSRPNSNTGDFSRAQSEWLKEDLKMHQRRFTIAFSHHPLLPPSPFDSGPPWDDYTVPNGDTAREIFGTSKYVRLVVNGHVHVTKVQQEKDIWYVSSPSLAVYPCAYRVFHVTPEAITVETYQISYPALIKKARNAFISCNLAYKYSSSKPATFALLAEGSRLDTDVLLPLVAGKPAQSLEKKKQPKSKKEKPKKVEKKTEPTKTEKSSDKGQKAQPEQLKEAPEANSAQEGEPKEAPDNSLKDLKVEPKSEPKNAAPSAGENND